MVRSVSVKGNARMVFSSLAVLMANFFLTLLLNYFFPTGFIQKATTWFGNDVL